MTKRRLSTDELITELLQEIRNDRVASTQREERVEAELANIRLALHELGKDFRSHREHAGTEASDTREQIRLVANFVGMTDPAEKNGSK